MELAAVREKATKWLGKYKYITLVVVVGVGLMLIPFGSKKENTVTSATQVPIQQLALDEELEKILCQIKGAGRVEVMLTIRSGSQTIYQTDTPSSDRQDTVIITGEDRVQSGLVQQIIPPAYRGAIILCQGADDPGVCLAIKEAVSKVTGLGASEISVLKMK